MQEARIWGQLGLVGVTVIIIIIIIIIITKLDYIKED